MTSYTSVESAIAALRSGAYDYLAKPFDDPAVISAVVGRAAEKIRLSRENERLIQDLKKTMDDIEDANRQLRDMAIRDGLTGLYNHRYLQEFPSLEVERSHRYSHGFSLIFVDVDHFKKYNDTHGHLQGDHLLRTMAAIFRTFFRKTDVIARYGGEEFMILLPETPKQVACRLAEELREAHRGKPFRRKGRASGTKDNGQHRRGSLSRRRNRRGNTDKEGRWRPLSGQGAGRNRICMA
ncbi:MAG: diguanylate cyclase [Desulfobacterales bacterium]|nr:diguanylate cyclase [Desulfobacterales bacterium]